MLETTQDPLHAGDGFGGDNVGFSVALSGDTALLGAPQINGRPGIGVADTNGAGYVLFREVSPPVTVTVPERQDLLIQGAKANTITGTVGGVQTADLKFFDIANVTLTTGAGDDNITLSADGLTAFGLLNFTVHTDGGNDTLTELSDPLKPPASGTFVLGGAGDPLYVQLTGVFTFDGGSGGDTLVAQSDTDWTLDTDTLTAGNGDSMVVTGVHSIRLVGGSGSNRLEVINWDGEVTLDGGEGADQYVVDMAALSHVEVDDTGDVADLDQLTVVGTAGNDQITVVAMQVQVDTQALDYDGVEIVRLAGEGGADKLRVQGAGAGIVILDGGDGSDTYEVFESVSTANVYTTDSGPLPGDGTNHDVLNVASGAVSLGGNRFRVGSTIVHYDPMIEELGFTTVPPNLELAGTDGSDTITLTATTLEINGLVVNLTGVLTLTVDGLDGDDDFVVLDVPSTLTEAPHFIGGDGSDTIFGPAGPVTWNFTGLNAGNVTGTGGFDFVGIENVTGGAGNDQFRFANNSAQLAGVLNGNGGTDTLDYSGRSSGAMIDLGNGTATAIGGTFSSIEIVIGSAAVDTLANASSIYNILGINSGNIDGTVTFSAIENITGGASDDTFNVASGARMTGTIAGGGGTDTLVFDTTSGDDIVAISGTAATINGVQQDYADMDTLTVNSLGGADSIALTVGASGFPTIVTLNAGEGDDEMEIHLTAGVATEIIVDGGAPSASDTVTVVGTGGDDVIAVNGLAVSFDASVIDLTAVEHLVVAAGEGNDTLTATGASVSGSIDLLGEGGEDVIAVTYPLATGQLTVDGGLGEADAFSLTLVEDDDEVALSATAVAVTGSVTAQYAGFESLSLETLGGVDSVTISDTHTGTTAVSTSAGEDTVIISHSSGILQVNTGVDADRAYIQAIAAEALVDLGEGEDLAVVSSNAPDAGTLDGIQGALTVLGGDGSDDLQVDSSAAVADLTGTVTSTRIEGLGMSLGLSYGAFESLGVTLGTGDDEISVTGTHPGTTLLQTRGGDDSVLVTAVDGALTVDTGEGDDAVEVRVTLEATSGDEGEEEPGAQPSPIAGPLTVEGGSGNDDLDVVSHSVVDETGTLTASTVTGLGMGTGITYGGVEDLELSLGNTHTTFTIESTNATTTTTLRTNDGADVVDVVTTAGLTNIFTGAHDDTVNVFSTGASTSIDTGADSDTVNVFTTGGISTISAGSGADTVNVQTIGAATTVNTGSEDDTINVGSLAPAMGGTVNGISAPLTIDGDAAATR